MSEPVRYGVASFLRWWLRQLLLDETGWLRWKLDERTTYDGGWDPPDYYTVGPPLRRAWETLKDWRYGYLKRPAAWSYLYDQDRSGDLRMFAPWRRFGPMQGWFA